MSRTLARAVAGLAKGCTAFLKPKRRDLTRALVAEAITPVVSAETPAGKLFFSGPTARSLHDPQGLKRDEPETVAWIDTLPQGEVLWDIGANVGTYALYAAKARRSRVLAFEPSAATYAVLIKNIEINGLADRIDAYCIAFSDRTALDHLFMANTGAGHSMHAFGGKNTVQGEIQAVFKQAVPGFSIDRFVELFDPPPPRHIKLDVDSIEERILRGAETTLRRHVETVMVEIDGLTRDAGGGGIRPFLVDLGFTEETLPGIAARRNVLFRK